jgi:hypothetical protein
VKQCVQKKQVVGQIKPSQACIDYDLQTMSEQLLSTVQKISKITI